MSAVWQTGDVTAANNETARTHGGHVTRYYKQIKVVAKDRSERAGDGSGQFITFMDKGCYDSDREGFTVNNGVLKFDSETADRVYYSGSSYWGEAMYIFTENYGRLNIRVEDSGITYVYALTAPPANVTTCALIKKPKQNSVNPVYPVNPAAANPVNPYGGGGAAAEKKWQNCGCCGGNGNCRNPRCSGGKQQCGTCGGSGQRYNSYTHLYERCSNSLCRGGYTTCGSCNGDGRCSCCKGKRGEYL
jgi:hypothetical protein